MKKQFLSLVISISLILTSSISPVFAQTENPANSLQEQKVQQFLQDYELIERCLRNRDNQQDEQLTQLFSSCFLLQVFDQENFTLTSAWRRALELNLVSRNTSPRETLTDYEFLKNLFEIAGVGLSPLSERNYREMFRDLRVRINSEELKIFGTAIENGIIAVPQTSAEAQLLQKDLQKTITVAEALGYLYQVSISEHDRQPTITVTPFNSSFNTSTIELEGVLKEIIRTIKNESYFKEDFDEKAAMEAAIKALVHSLGEDKYIEYYTEDEYKSFSDGLNGNLEGIGAYIEEKDGLILVVSPISGSPAEKAGLKAQDVITHINGQSTEGMTIEQAINLIRGPQGSQVKLNIKRAGQTLNISITRAQIDIPAVTTEDHNGIKVVKLVQFSATSASEMQTALENIIKENPRGIVIDLRNNPGGFLDQVVTMVDFFIEANQTVVYLQDHVNRTAINSNTSPLIKNIPISVLINKGSASASEILAGALQSYGIAKIYGETSYGKGTVQNIITLRDDTQYDNSAFKFTSAEYLVGGPNGKSVKIDGIGVIPDSNPSNTNPLIDNPDTPNDEALDAVLKSF